MTVTTPGHYFPNWGPTREQQLVSSYVLNTATEKLGLIGDVYWADGASHTVSSAGGALVFCMGSTVAFANAGTTIDFGIQDVHASNGPPGQDVDSFDVKASYVGGTDTLTASVAKTILMTAGSKTIADGAQIAVVIKMVSRGGSDGITLTHASGPNTAQTNSKPFTIRQRVTFGYGVDGPYLPNFAIKADDGAWGVFSTTVPLLQASSENFNSGSSPVERGLAFKVPYDFTINSIGGNIMSGGASMAATVSVYADPFGTPTSLGSISLKGNQFAANNLASWREDRIAAITGSANTFYGIAVKPTASTNIGIGTRTLLDTNIRQFFDNGTTISKITRNSGAFTAESPAVTMYDLVARMNVNVSAGGGGARFAGTIF